MKRVVVFGILLTAAGCIEVQPGLNDAAPLLISGGGVASGAIRGRINVYAIDALTETAIAGARVRVESPGAGTTFVGTTDANGLLVLRDDAIAGLQNVTVYAPGYAPATWVGVNGANATLPLNPYATAMPYAEVSGTIDGWQALPAPAQGHYTAALIGYSFVGDVGGPENRIEQPLIRGRPGNLCLRASSDPVACGWSMHVRRGPQIHVAVLFDGEQLGTMPNPMGDPITILGYAVQTGLSFQPGDQVSDEVLTMLPADALQTLTAQMLPPPAGMVEPTARAALDVGDAGMFLFSVPAFTAARPTWPVPALRGPLAGSSYALIAHTSAPSGTPESTLLLHDVSTKGTSWLGDWIEPPGGLSISSSGYAFAPATGAMVYAVGLRAAGRSVWDVILLDGSNSFQLPALAPDPLPEGEIRASVTAVDLPGIDVGNFQLHRTFTWLTRSSTGPEVTFAHGGAGCAIGGAGGGADLFLAGVVLASVLLLRRRRGSRAVPPA